MPRRAPSIAFLFALAVTGVRAQGLPADALERDLAALREATSERAAFSATDTRRYALARRLLAADASSALAHEELALRALLEFDWRRQMARRQGGWDGGATRGMSGGANRARARVERHLADALAADPARPDAHRLALRLAALAEDDRALAEAASAFRAARPHDGDAALYAGLVAFRAGDLVLAEARFAEARAALPEDDARALDDPARFYSADEVVLATTDPDAAAARAWRMRDPLLLTPQNERHLEHAARLALADLLFGRPREQKRGWETARGEVLLRYGPPDYDAAWLDSDFRTKSFGRVHRWIYAGPDGFTLTFEDAFRGDELDFPSSAFGEDEATRARSLFRRTPERYALRPPGGVLDVTALVSQFRGKNGRTDLVVALAAPLAAPDALEAGAFLLDADAQIAAEIQETTRATRPGLTWEGALALSADPGPHTLAVEVAQPSQRTAGAAREGINVQRFDPGFLALSDLLLATATTESDDEAAPGTIRRGEWLVRPAARAAFAARTPIHVYVEAYNLAVNDGLAAYEVEVQLRPRDSAGSLARLARRALGRRPPAGVAVRFDAETAGPDDQQAVALDATGQPPGPYVLTLRVRDRATGASAEASREIVLE